MKGKINRLKEIRIELDKITEDCFYDHYPSYISNVNKEYFEDLNGDCQDYVMSLDKYKDMDYDTMVGLYDEPIEQKNNKELELFRKQINESNKKSA